MKIKIMQIGLKTLGIITTGLNRGVHSHQHTQKKILTIIIKSQQK